MLFFAGQVFTLLALNTGDVSVATPVLALKILLVALLSTLRHPVGFTTSHAYRPWLAAGAFGFAVQGLMFMSSISIYRQATSANVLYSSRGLWSVVGWRP